jgi:hypothetical protein
MEYMALTADQLNDAYDILEQECGARASGRDEFVEGVTQSLVERRERSWQGGIEYRFMGNLGFGGKFWINNGRVYVNAYRENETPKILASIERANARLEALFPWRW